MYYGTLLLKKINKYRGFKIPKENVKN